MECCTATESTHHSSRGQRTARARVWGREMNCTATIRDPPTPQLVLFSLYEELGGARPDRLWEVRPQDSDLRRTVDQTVDAVPGLRALDVPVPQMVDQPLAATTTTTTLLRGPATVSWWRGLVPVRFAPDGDPVDLVRFSSHLPRYLVFKLIKET